MVPADIPPGKADLPNNPVVASIERKIIEHDVSRGDPEGSLDAIETANDVIADEIDLGMTLWLGICKEHRIKAPRPLCPDQCKIDGFGKRPCWRETRIEEVEAGRSSLWLMDVGETRQPCFL